jgi:hypothetical protein
MLGIIFFFLFHLCPMNLDSIRTIKFKTRKIWTVYVQSNLRREKFGQTSLFLTHNICNLHPRFIQSVNTLKAVQYLRGPFKIGPPKLNKLWMWLMRFRFSFTCYQFWCYNKIVWAEFISPTILLLLRDAEFGVKYQWNPMFRKLFLLHSIQHSWFLPFCLQAVPHSSKNTSLSVVWLRTRTLLLQ